MSPSNGDGSDDVLSATDEFRAKLLQTSWRQGSVLPAALSQLVTPVPHGFVAGVSWPNDRWYVVVSQDCDLVHGNINAEPLVEVVLARKKSKLRGSFEHLRSPRMLHVPLTRANGTVQPTEVVPTYRGFFDRQLLLDHAPSVDLHAAPKAINEIALLLSRRYSRNNRPENFDTAISAELPAVENLLDREVAAGVLLDILVEIKPNSELENVDDRYSVHVVGVLQDAFDDQPKNQTRSKIDEIARELFEIFSRVGSIDLEGVDIVGRSQISIRQRETLRSLEIVWPRLSTLKDD